MKVFVVCQIWDGDCIEPSVLGIYSTAAQANAACHKFVRQWSISEPVNKNEGEDLAHWEWDAGLSLFSAKVDEFDLDVSEWPIGDVADIVVEHSRALINFFREIVDCEHYDYERIDDGEFRHRATRLLDALEGQEEARQ